MARKSELIGWWWLGLGVNGKPRNHTESAEYRGMIQSDEQFFTSGI
jgi:hypothetical protein